MFKKIIFLFLILFSSFVFADTYPVVVTYEYGNASVSWTTNQQTVCNYYSGSGYTIVGSQYPSATCKNSVGATVGISSRLVNTCPAGGTVSGGSCINAPACTTGQVRNSQTEACQTPPTCTFPSTYDNLSDSCITPACPTGQSRLPAPDYTCATNPTCPSIVPLCASTAYDCNNGDGTQQHIVQCSTVCPTGKHMVGNDCVDDKTAPISCPAGFEYNTNTQGCVAAAPLACPTGTRSGTVNGETVCVSAGSKTPSSPDESHNTGTGTGTETGTSTTMDANGNIISTTTTTTNTTQKIDLNTTGLASESTQKGILNALTENGKAPQSVTAANTSDLDTSESTAEGQASISNPGSYFIQSFVVLPTSTCQAVPMHYKSLNYDFDPCTKLQLFRDLMGYFLYIITLIFIYQEATRSAGD